MFNALVEVKKMCPSIVTKYSYVLRKCSDKCSKSWVKESLLAALGG